MKEQASYPGKLRVEAVQWPTPQDRVNWLSWLQPQSVRAWRHSLAPSGTKRSEHHRLASGLSDRAGTADWESDGRR
jgi:hypothetical protein